jgi:hypothetical protein
MGQWARRAGSKLLCGLGVEPVLWGLEEGRAVCRKAKEGRNYN